MIYKNLQIQMYRNCLTATSFKINKQSQPIILRKHLICIYAQKSRSYYLNNYPSQKSTPTKRFLSWMDQFPPVLLSGRPFQQTSLRMPFRIRGHKKHAWKKTVYYIRMRNWRNRNWLLAKRVCKKKLAKLPYPNASRSDPVWDVDSEWDQCALP